MRVTTIHVIELPGGGLSVCTTASSPNPAERMAPSQSMAVDLLRHCERQGVPVTYWQGSDKAMEFLADLSEPEGLGYADKGEIVRAAAMTLGRIHHHAAARLQEINANTQAAKVPHHPV